MAKNLKTGTSICITSAKGGVGKTTTVLNLAGMYELMQKKVLLIDLDLTNGGIALSLNKPYEKSISTLFQDINNNKYEELSSYVTKYDDYIDILPCAKDPREANKINTSLIDVILDRAAFSYDVILIDTTHIFNDINLYTLDKSDKVLYLLSNDPVDLKNMKNVIAIFESLNITKYKVLLNDSFSPFKNYFSLYDIKNIIKTNIDYYLTNRFFIQNIDKYIMDSQILTLDKKIAKSYSKDYTVLMNIALDLIGGEDNE